MASTAELREQYFCVVCGCLATPQEKQILFDGMEPLVSIHHNCYNKEYQPLSKAEIKSTYIPKYGQIAVKHALDATRHAAGPLSIDGEPQEFYLLGEFLGTIRRYQKEYSNKNSPSRAGAVHFTRGDSSPVSSLNRTDRSSAGRASKKLNSNAATLSTTKKLKKKKETSNVPSELSRVREEYKNVMGTAARGKFANNLDGMRSAISRQLKQMAEDGGTKKSDNENENDLVLESTFDGAGDDLDAMSGSDYDHEAGTDGSYSNEIEEHLYDENETEKDIDSQLHGFNRGAHTLVAQKMKALQAQLMATISMAPWSTTC